VVRTQLDQGRAQRSEGRWHQGQHPIYIWSALATWAPKLTGKQLIIECDSETVCYCGNSLASRAPRLSRLLRVMAFITCSHNITLHFTHVVGATNVAANLLSRGQINQFRLRFSTSWSSMTQPSVQGCTHEASPAAPQDYTHFLGEFPASLKRLQSKKTKATLSARG
jgi:hypothetical protein